MTEAEQLEKARQAIMRFRELLDIIQQQLEDGERAYDRLFAALNAAETAGLQTKAIQGLAAHEVAANPEPLRRAALHQSFSCRNMERDFAQVHDALVFDAE
jgi:hypothetical protein